MLLTREPR